MPARLRIVRLVFLFAMFGIVARLFYWQVLSGDKLQAVAEIQRSSTIEIQSTRGRILAADGYPLVTNQPSYLLFAYLPAISADKAQISETLSPLIAPTPLELKATPSAELTKSLIQDTKSEVFTKLTSRDVAWVPLKRKVSENTKIAVEKLAINGLGFENGQSRLYPEASM